MNNALFLLTCLSIPMMQLLSISIGVVMGMYFILSRIGMAERWSKWQVRGGVLAWFITGVAASGNVDACSKAGVPVSGLDTEAMLLWTVGVLPYYPAILLTFALVAFLVGFVFILGRR